jgi:hypothetical protein
VAGEIAALICATSPGEKARRPYGAFRRWQAGGCFDIIFTVVVLRLHQSSLLDVTMICR